MSLSARRPLLAMLGVLLAGGLSIAVLARPAVSVLGHRGAARLAEGFRSGRWDARFLVARSDAAVVLPGVPLRVGLMLSGPARLRVRAGDVERQYTLAAEPSPVDVRLPAGGRIELKADAALRLHALHVARLDGTPWPRVLLLLAVTLAMAAVAGLRTSLPTVASAVAVTLLAGVVALRGGFPGLAAAALFDRGFPLLVLAGLALAPLAILLVPRAGVPGARPSAMDLRLAVGCGALLFLSCAAQLALYEQPLLIGDPAAYHEIAGRFRDALLGVRSLDGLADALQELRPYGGLFTTGIVYGALRALSDRLAVVYLAHALALAGCGFLLVSAARRLGGTPLAAITAGLVLSYVSFPVLAGLFQPEPFILLLWTASFALLLAARERSDPRGAALSGLAFGIGLALHPQGLWFLLLALALVLSPFARRLLQGNTRRLAAGFAVGVLPALLWTAVGEGYARPVTPVLDERHGFWAYTASYPLGFWLFLDSDGWQGPLRIDDTRYARELKAAEIEGAGQAVFTAAFVARNAGASARTVLRNLHRLWHEPDNPPRRDFLLPHALQVRWHRTLVALFLLAAALALPGPAALAYVPFAILSACYPLYHVFNKYAVPATPFLLLGAALALRRIASERQPALAAALLCAGLGAVIAPASLAFLGVPIAAAHAATLVLHLGGLSAAFAIAYRRWARERVARVLTVLAWGVLVVPALAAEWGDPSWRTFSVALDREAQQEIVLGPEETAQLDGAREAYLALDLLLPSGDPSPLELRFASGLVVAGKELQPSMPSFGLATLRFHRDPRSFRQWWRVAWRPEMAQAGRVRLEIRGRRDARLFGALAEKDATVARGPSLGQWPYLSVYRLMHDGEYRLPLEQPLGGLGRSSRWAGALLPGSLGVRVLRLEEGRSLARVETAPVPAAARAIVTAVWARTSPAGLLDLELPGQTLPLRFEDRGTVAQSPGRNATEVRFVPTGEAQGHFLIRMPAPGPGPLTLTFRPRQEMASPPRFLLPDLRAPAPIPLDWTGSPYVPVVRLLEGRADPWQPAAVY